MRVTRLVRILKRHPPIMGMLSDRLNYTNLCKGEFTGVWRQAFCNPLMLHHFLRFTVTRCYCLSSTIKYVTALAMR